MSVGNTETLTFVSLKLCFLGFVNIGVSIVLKAPGYGGVINAKIRIHNIFLEGVLLLWRRGCFLSGGVQSLCFGGGTFPVEGCNFFFRRGYFCCGGGGVF